MIDKIDNTIEKTILKYAAEIINGAINNNEKGLYIPPVKKSKIAN